LENNANIKIDKLYIKQLEEEKEISLRIENPKLEIGLLQFNQNASSSQKGYSIELNQSIQ